MHDSKTELVQTGTIRSDKATMCSGGARLRDSLRQSGFASQKQQQFAAATSLGSWFSPGQVCRNSPTQLMWRERPALGKHQMGSLPDAWICR